MSDFVIRHFGGRRRKSRACALRWKGDHSTSEHFSSRRASHMYRNTPYIPSEYVSPKTEYSAEAKTPGWARTKARSPSWRSR